MLLHLKPATLSARGFGVQRRTLPCRTQPCRTHAADVDTGVLGGSFARAGVGKVTVHGRHMEVTPELEERVLRRLEQSLLKLLASAEYLEAEGGVQEVDVRLMATQAEITLRPQQLNKQLHDTYLRQGKLHCITQDPSAGAFGNFEQACEQLERKLKAWKRAPPSKVRYSTRASGSGSSSSIGGVR